MQIRNCNNGRCITYRTGHFTAANGVAFRFAAPLDNLLSRLDLIGQLRKFAAGFLAELAA